jgi:hypothetical protein
MTSQPRNQREADRWLETRRWSMPSNRRPSHYYYTVCIWGLCMKTTCWLSSMLFSHLCMYCVRTVGHLHCGPSLIKEFTPIYNCRDDRVLYTEIHVSACTALLRDFVHCCTIMLFCFFTMQHSNTPLLCWLSCTAGWVTKFIIKKFTITIYIRNIIFT